MGWGVDESEDDDDDSEDDGTCTCGDSEDDEGLSAGDEEEGSEDDGPSLSWGIRLDQFDSVALRFTLGDAVRCKFGSSWEEGTVVKLGYVQSCFPEGRCAPYQIRLGDGRFIYAPADDDYCIRKLEIADELAADNATECCGTDSPAGATGPGGAKYLY